MKKLFILLLIFVSFNSCKLSQKKSLDYIQYNDIDQVLIEEYDLNYSELNNKIEWSKYHIQLKTYEMKLKKNTILANILNFNVRLDNDNRLITISYFLRTYNWKPFYNIQEFTLQLFDNSNNIIGIITFGIWVKEYTYKIVNQCFTLDLYYGNEVDDIYKVKFIPNVELWIKQY